MESGGNAALRLQEDTAKKGEATQRAEKVSVKEVMRTGELKAMM